MRREFNNGLDDRNRKAWDHGSRTLNWVDVQEALWYVRSSLNSVYKDFAVDQIASVSWLHGLLWDVGPDVKSRFQLAGVVNENGTLVRICYVRCKSGHNKRVAALIPKDSLYTKIEPGHLRLISCICHKTKLEHIRSIFLNGLIPGGIMSRSNRAHSNFTPFPPFDKRNIASGRLAGEYDVVIIFNKEKLMKYDLQMSMSAVLVTDANLPWTTIDLIYVIPPINSGQAWVLYDPDYIDKTITGNTAPSSSEHAKTRQSKRDATLMQGQYGCGLNACTCCESLNPEGFTSCLNCRVKFSFDEIAEVSKVARGSGKKSGNAGSAPSGSNALPVEMVSLEAAATEAIRIAKFQQREDKGLQQVFHRPGDILWELVNGNMKWRLRYDCRPDAEKRDFIAEGKSRFCAGAHFKVSSSIHDLG